MKRKSLLIMLLVALFVPLAMNAQTRSLHSPKLDKLEMNSAVARENAQNERFVKSPVQIPNLESSKFSLGNSDNTMGGRGTRDVIYEPVLSSQTDWSGNYVLAVPFGDNVGYAFGSVDADDHTAGIEEVTMDANYNITSIGNASVLTIAHSTSNSSYYTIKINGGDYLSEGTSGLETSSTETNYTNWSISLTSDGMQLYNPVWSGGPYYLYFLLFENTSTSQYGAFWFTDDGTTYTDGAIEGYTFEYILPYLFKETTSGGGSDDCDYEKVTASQSDWSGDYVITYTSGTTAYVLTGQSGSNNYGAYTTATITDNTLSNADVASYNVTIEKITYNNSTYYTIKIGDTYLWQYQDGNSLYFSTTDPSTLTGNTRLSYYWTISYSSNTLSITNARYTNRFIKWNTRDRRFASYKSTSGNTADISLFKKLTDCAPACPTPTNLTYSNVTGEGATLAWNGEADSYTIQIGPAPKTYGFEDGTLQGWTAYDADGDGYSWNADNSTSSSGATYYHSGTYYAMASYNESAAVDNWLISPQIQLGGSISFWVRRLSTSWTDSYRVYVSTTNTDISSFTEISSGTITPGTSYTQASYPLSSYSGTGYVAIRHTAAADQAYVFVDDITIVEGGQTISNATSPYTVTGLNPATEYVWQVKADCGDGNVSPWSTSSTFTTLDLCAAPTDLAADNITNNSAELSWTGETDTYNIQYHVVDPDAPATLILNVPTDIWGDGTGYQLVLDADHNTYGSTIPTSASFTADSFAEFEYTIPENAECSLTTNTIVVNGSASITIPAGVYDYALLNPDGSSTYWIASSNGNFPGRGDDYEFEAGKTYELRVYQSGTNDAVDLTISADWTSVSGTVTSPYTLTGLNPETTYEWQVKGDGCTDWSASNTFTTSNNIPVESITASDVTVVVGATATITPTVSPGNATDPSVTYTSADATIATVDANGLVTGVAPGNTTITITSVSTPSVTATINVTVNGIDVTAITASNVTVVNGQTATINYNVTPSNATDQSVTFTTADATIATVDASGVVTGVGVGETTITIASVSNPGVTATINVTVTSNPNAVQFTVNAPATAHPGETITVDFMLAAPTAGTYTGFTGLDVNLYFDNTAFQYNSKANGEVANAVADIDLGQVSISGPNTNNPNRVKALLVTPANYPVTTEGIVFSVTLTVLQDVTLGSYTFDAAFNEFDYTTGEVGNSNTVDIVYEFTPSTVVITNEYRKPIIGWDNQGGGYYLIASPIGDVLATEVGNMIPASGSGFDLYYFDHSKDLEWVNYRGGNQADDPGFASMGGKLVTGKGYLYANKYNDTLIFTGSAHTATNGVESFDLDYTDTGDGYTIDLPGWNLMGNPFAVKAWPNRSFYTLKADGSIFVAVTSGSVEAMEGIFVQAQATETNPTVTFSTTDPNAKSPTLALNLIKATTGSAHLIDRAIVRFDQGDQLNKFQLFKGSTKVYIPQDGQDYAIVSSEEVGEMPVNFKAEDNGTYTLSFSAENVEFGYLHLIDNMTGKDIDLLETPSYSFEAKTTDYESRFKLVFATGDNSKDDNFAYFSNGSFVINNDGEATLQVVDVMGRIIKSENINGCANLNVNAAPGVYMLRLVNGADVKVQKVVVK